MVTWQDLMVPWPEIIVSWQDLLVHWQDLMVPLQHLMVPWQDLHCNKKEGEIPVHTHDDAGRQRSTTGKYFPSESGVNTCFAPAVFDTSGIFP